MPTPRPARLAAAIVFCLTAAGLKIGCTRAADSHPATRPSSPSPFLFFDATSYVPKPDNLRFRGLSPAVCETSGTIESFARRALAERALLILDLEPLPDYEHGPDQQVEQALRSYSDAVDRARAVAPTLAIGCYHFPWDRRELRSHRDDGSWDERGFADRLNFSCPQVYFYRGQTYADWEKEAARRLAIGRSFDRPSYAFLNTTHFTPPYEQVDIQLLRRAVQFIRGRADGIIWWGGWRYETLPTGREAYRQDPWDENANWLKVTLESRFPDPPATRPAAPHQ